ncbi:Mitochondrial proton/calcium exchanger protein [Pseudolycoriella hygida]|uniref:Mitochondrial proton/calcium exchanger protein n=1 Tax=Pseudolycoriella hygida TaxID=35572 RepID=A0A9Q0S7V4_9DIPT|nr:Mitochondrial proton/calcium exchanger protein [Pseudolycoriella hygida]
MYNPLTPLLKGLFPKHVTNASPIRWQLCKMSQYRIHTGKLAKLSDSPFVCNRTVLPALSHTTSSYLPSLPATALSHHTNGFGGSSRHFSLTSCRYEQSSSKVEETVKAIQEKEKSKDAPKVEATSAVQKVVEKKSIKQRVWEELVHYYHGFRLLFININVARKLLWKVLNGKTLTRREHMLLIRTTGDMFRLVPFSVFIIVPFMELLLPVFIKFFPGMLPSTFETTQDKEDKARKNLKVKLEMAKFLQQTLDEMDVQHSDHKSSAAKEFITFFHKLRTAGEMATPEEILKFSKLFEDEITLDSLTRPQLIAICRVLDVSTLGGSSNFLRFQLRMKLRSLSADDRLIQKEGIDTLNLHELQNACRSRGMRSYGLSEFQLKTQLTEWINLSLHEKVPPSLLLLSRAMMLPEDVPTAEKLKASISVLPDSAAIQTKAAIGEREGKIDNKTKIDIIRDEQRKIKEELEEETETAQVTKVQKVDDTLVDKAPIIVESHATAPAPTAISNKDIDVVVDALGEVSKEKKTLLVEKEEIRDLKEEIAEYKEDIEELHVISEATEKAEKITQSVASKRLLKKVDSMISKLDKVLEDLENKEKKIQEVLKADGTTDSGKTTELVRIDEIVNAIRKMQKLPDEPKLQQIHKMLGKIDVDKDGQLKVDDVLKIIATIGKENVNLNETQIDELIELITKEETLEHEDKIVKALAKSKEERKAASDQCEELVDKAPEITNNANTSESASKPASKIDERISNSVKQNAAEAAERQKDKIIPLSGDVKTPQLSPSAGATNPKDKLL